ncbi:MAG: NADH-quinone oxidoreductase subunit I, partial [Aeromicrobium sp.]
DLLAPLLPGMEQPPHPMRLGADEAAYYRNTYAAPEALVTTGTPGPSGQEDSA